MSSPNLSTERDFVERLGLLVEAEGLPRIAGRLLGYVLTHRGPFHADDLRRGLKVSHGSVSSNTRLLERIGILERVSFAGDRKSYFQLTADPFARLLDGSLERARRIQDLVTTTRVEIGSTNPQARKNLAAMERFYRMATRLTEDLLDQWRSSSGATS